MSVWVLGALCILLGWRCYAAATSENTYVFDIPAQSLPSALLRFSAQVDKQIIVASRLVDQYATVGVSGSMTVEQAMTRLLHGTDLSFEALGTSTLRVIRAPSITRTDTDDVHLAPRAEFEVKPREQEITGMDAVIVMARRIEENVQDVPIAMNVFSEATLKMQDIRSFTDLETLMPGVDSCCGRGIVSAFTFIRGINNTVGYFAEVPTLLNGSAFYFDIENFEVLKGPQGTLFGIATNGGAVLVEPARPTHTLEGYAAFTFGDFDRQEFEGVINLPVSDTFALRLGLQRERRDGYVRDITNHAELGDENYWIARISSLWNITDEIENYEVWNYHASDRSPEPLGIPYGPTAGIAPNGLFAQAFAGPALNAWIERSLALGPYAIVGTDVPGGPRDMLRQSNVTDILSYTVSDDLKIKNIFGFYSTKENTVADTDATPFGGYETGIPPTTFSGPTIQYSDELQAQGTTLHEQLHYVVGSFNRWNNVDDPGITYQQVLGVKSALQSVQSGRTHSLFAEGTYALDKWVRGLAVTAGYRETWDERSARQELYNAQGTPLSNFDANARWAKGSYRAGLTYHPSSNVMLYFTNSKGYSAGGFNLTAPDLADEKYNPEILNNFEVGVKSEWSIGGVRGRTNFAAYYGIYDQIQAQVTTRCQTAVGPVFCQITRNAAEGDIDGAEAEFTVIPNEWVSISGNFGFMEGRYSKYRGLDPTGSVMLDLSDTGFLYLPKWKYAINSTVKIPTPDLIGNLSISPAWSWTARINCCFTVGPPQYYTTSPQMKNLNLTFNLSEIGGIHGLSSSLVITNVTQNEVLHGQWGVYEQLGQYARAIALPRMWALTLRYDF